MSTPSGLRSLVSRALSAGKTALVNVVGDRTIGHPSLVAEICSARPACSTFGRSRLVKHSVDGPDGGSGHCGRNFPLIQRCIQRSRRAGHIRALVGGKCPLSAPFELLRS
jgi:hypothetical protein